MTVTVVEADTSPGRSNSCCTDSVPVTLPGLTVLVTVAIVSDDEIQLAKMRS